MFSSAYTLRLPISRSPKNNCYYCGRKLVEWPHSAISKTRDHVWPRCYKPFHENHLAPAHGYKNIRIACQMCNELRGELDHSCGALMIAVMHAHKTGVTPRRGAIDLGMLPTAAEKLRRLKEQNERRYAHKIAARAEWDAVKARKKLRADNVVTNHYAPEIFSP